MIMYVHITINISNPIDIFKIVKAYFTNIAKTIEKISATLCLPPFLKTVEFIDLLKNAFTNPVTTSNRIAIKVTIIMYT